MSSRAAIVSLFALGSAFPALCSEPRPGQLETPVPVHEVMIQKEVWVPMRDGVRLAAEVYLPKGVTGKLPVILMRTPYGKEGTRPREAGHFFAGQGFAVVAQDFRGKHASEGFYRFTRGHPEDGYDTMKWVAAQPWSSGKIGTYGCSYLGEVQLYQAQSRPPWLVTMIPQASGSAVGSSGGYFNNGNDLGSGNWGIGVRFDWWFRNASQVRDAKLPNIDYDAILRTLPVIDMMKRAGGPPTEWEERVARQYDLTDPYWQAFDYITPQTTIGTPALFIESWNDWGTPAALHVRNQFERNAARKLARENQFIIVSPSPHCQSESMTAEQKIGDFDAGDPRFGHWDIYLRWFDYWLRGERNAITSMPKIQYYLLGKNEWRAAETWPVPGTQQVKFFLGSGGRANSHFGDGKLTFTAPPALSADTYTYDPGAPTPSAGINDYRGSKPILDQRDLSARNDILVYTSAPLTEAVEMTGEIEVRLFVSSSVKDTDFIAKLVDVYPDGRAFNVRENVIRARYRNGRDRPPELMESDRVYPVSFRLGAYSLYWPAGHRVRLQIASAAFPKYERNLNTGGRNYDETQWVVARNTVHHGGDRASYVSLPFVSGSAPK